MWNSWENPGYGAVRSEIERAWDRRGPRQYRYTPWFGGFNFDEHLVMRNLSARWMPCLLINDDKCNRVSFQRMIGVVYPRSGRYLCCFVTISYLCYLTFDEYQRFKLNCYACRKDLLTYLLWGLSFFFSLLPLPNRNQEKHFSSKKIITEQLTINTYYYYRSTEEPTDSIHPHYAFIFNNLCVF